MLLKILYWGSPSAPSIPPRAAGTLSLSGSPGSTHRHTDTMRASDWKFKQKYGCLLQKANSFTKVISVEEEWWVTPLLEETAVAPPPSYIHEHSFEKEERKKKREKRKETKARQAPYSQSYPRTSPSPPRVKTASKDINIFPYLRSHRRQKPFHFGPILMPILVPQLSLSSLPQASHTNKSMSGTASDTLTEARPAANLPTCNPQLRGAPFLERPSSLSLLSLSLSLHNLPAAMFVPSRLTNDPCLT